MLMICVVRQTSVIACYGPFADRDTALEFQRVYLDHESNVQIVTNYGTFDSSYGNFLNRDEMKYV